jgi:hypothetical protein
MQRVGLRLLNQHLSRTVELLPPPVNRSIRPMSTAASASRHAYVGSYTGFQEKGVLGWVGTANAGAGITCFTFDEARSAKAGFLRYPGMRGRPRRPAAACIALYG